MTKVQLKIIERAIQIRLDKGEELTDILNSYTKLLDKERQDFKDKFSE